MDAAILALEYPEGAKALRIQAVSEERRQIYARIVPELSSGDVKGVLCELDGEKVQHIVHCPAGGAPKVVIVEEACKIMFDDLSPSQMIEYRFKESPQWHLGWMGEESADGYRRQKFKSWREMFDKPTCEAAFKRMLQTGLVTRLYDTVALPTPAEDVAKWTVVNEETGKKIDIPHPVHEMRVWDAEKEAYRTIASLLEGAPEDDKAGEYWEKLLQEQKDKHGADVIAKLMAE
ncbi:hypothetical protein DIPPA_18760 [Diplonema papillatum]|nr:hypothetical protein DIPPA_18760 [Diplonema papillatum]